jgi:pentatricopeptide repeat protein
MLKFERGTFSQMSSLEVLLLICTFFWIQLRMESNVLWTSMIAGYIQNGHFGSALTLFCKLLSSGRKPDEFIISSVLGACANLATPRSGQQIQGYAIKTGIGNFTVTQFTNLHVCKVWRY